MNVLRADWCATQYGDRGEVCSFFFSSRRRHTRCSRDWSSDVCSSDLYKALLEARPDWAGLMAIHHGSLDRGVREWVEAGLKAGTLKAVVCTSSLDLGVDFLPVERVLQIGSAKGIARLLQRAGRSGHAPGRPSRITLV